MDLFGYSAALSADGSTLAVGAYGKPPRPMSSSSGAGAVYVFTRTGATWAQSAKLVGSNTVAGDQFGESLAISSDGATLAVGAPNHLVNPPSYVPSGSVYALHYSTSWSEQGILAPSHDQNGGFGYGVAISGDASMIMVGDPSSRPGDVNHSGSPGAVYEFTPSGASWAEHAYLSPTNLRDLDHFGIGLALSIDGMVLAAGAQMESSDSVGITYPGPSTPSSTMVPHSGAVYVFQ
jgi:hypothetical protein